MMGEGHAHALGSVRAIHWMSPTEQMSAKITWHVATRPLLPVHGESPPP